MTIDEELMGTDGIPQPIPAATVVLLRDGDDGPEVLLLRRHHSLSFAGGMWVFPGGRIDAGDRADHDGDDAELAAARRAAAREAEEEAGLVVPPEGLVGFAHWTPPPVQMKRYATWFFAAPAPVGTVVVDGDEATDHVWTRPADALARRDAGEIELTPPTFVTLTRLTAYPTVTDALADLGATDIEYFATRFGRTADGGVALWEGDAGYDTADPDAPGARHRLWMLEGAWRYDRALSD